MFNELFTLLVFVCYMLLQCGGADGDLRRGPFLKSSSSKSAVGGRQAEALSIFETSPPDYE
jgi:hypothetical protein